MTIRGKRDFTNSRSTVFAEPSAHYPIAQTIVMLLDAVRAHAGIALRPDREQALANCLRLADLARRFERGASSFRAFVEQIEAAAESDEAAEAPIVEEGTEGVRVMTVHKAKGLEFPIVILADPSCPATHDIPSRHVDPARRLWLEPLCGRVPAELLETADEELQRDQAEAVRLVYVAGHPRPRPSFRARRRRRADRRLARGAQPGPLSARRQQAQGRAGARVPHLRRRQRTRPRPWS
jgi:superfamily I DNA/RNA helicase